MGHSRTSCIGASELHLSDEQSFLDTNVCVQLCYDGADDVDEDSMSSTLDGNPPNQLFLADSSCRDRALLVLGSNTAKQAALTALLDPSTHSRPPLTHTSHHRPALVNLSRFIAVSGVTHSRFRRFSTCVSAVSGVSLVGVSLLSADVAVTLVRPEVISQRVFISRGRTRAHWKALVKAHTMGQ